MVNISDVQSLANVELLRAIIETTSGKTLHVLDSGLKKNRVSDITPAGSNIENNHTLSFVHWVRQD